MQLFSCGAGRVKTYRQWKAWVELGRLRFSAEFAWYGQGVGVVFLVLGLASRCTCCNARLRFWRTTP